MVGRRSQLPEYVLYTTDETLRLLVNLKTETRKAVADKLLFLKKDLPPKDYLNKSAFSFPKTLDNCMRSADSYYLSESVQKFND